MIMYVKNLIKQVTRILVILLFVFSASYSFAATPAGYSEYYIPGDEDLLRIIWGNIGSTGGVPTTMPNAARHTIISVVAWSDNTTVYYDHWENGYGFDPNNPSSADETYTLNKGQSHIFESNNIPVNPRGTSQYYDGGDHIYVAGGVVSVTRMSWIDNVGTVFSIAMEVYPVKPQMTRYVLPFGEDLAAAPRNYRSFDRVFALVQATEDNTIVQFDFNGDGTYDTFCTDQTRTTCDAAHQGSQVTLNRGQSFLLDDWALSPQAAPYNTVHTGTVVNGSATLQVTYINGNHTDTYQSRAFSAFPSGFWDTEYYAPVDSANGTALYPTNLYLYNPNSSAMTINYETTAGSGSFSVPATSTRSFYELTGSYVPQGSGIYLKGSDVFWGVAQIDDGGPTHEWGYSLIPKFLLGNEQFVGWAPAGTSTLPAPAGNRDDAGIFITPAQDNTRVFVDTNNDGTADLTYTLNRMQTQYAYNSTTGDMSNSHIWATGPVSLAYGQNPALAPTGAPAIDVGYGILPGGDFIDKVLTVAKSANPVVVPTASGSTSTYTLSVNSYYFAVDGISVVDTLPSGWQYVSNSTTITLADKTTVSGSSANPALSGGNLVLTWPSTLLHNMAPNQNITITFTAQTTQAFSLGTITRNVVQAKGTRTVSGATQTFVTSDFAFNSYGNLTVSKTSSAATPLYPGNQFIYTVTVTNPSGAAFTGVSVYDPLTAGVSYVTDSLQASPVCSFRDNFGTAVYTNNDGSCTWSAAWVEVGEADGTGAGQVRITGGQLRFRGASNLAVPRGVQRTVDLSSARSANIVFDGTTTGVVAGDIVSLQVSTDGATWSTLATFNGTQNLTQQSYAIPTSSFSSTTYVRLSVTQGYGVNTKYFYADNFHIDIQPKSPPELLSKGVGYILPAAGTLTITYNVTVDNPLAPGIDQITNTAFINCNEIPLPAGASVTNIVVNPSSQSAIVGDRVWFDVNGNGLPDVGEPGLVNVEVTLKNWLGASVMTTTTDSTGHFLFTGVEPGNGYYIELTSRTIPSGFQQSAPAGRSDNRTNAFNLTAGQSYMDADLGYKSAPGSAVVGNIVWSDANSSGTRNAGEPGLAGVTVQFYRDTNSNGIFEPGTDTLWGTTTTAADGSYLFTGVPASGTEDYFVYIDGTQAKLTGYTRTAPSNDPLYVNNLSAGDFIQYANFGYHSGTTYSITDRIWFDANSNGSLDAGETGIALVTVDLLDASHNAIATTTTDANGYFTFSGVIGSGADYTVRITDTNGKLANYFGTTTSANTGTKQIINLAGNVDYSLTPNFGYGLKNSIVGAVFNDINNNGALNSGEPGISGVTVKLYTDTIVPYGQINAGDTLIATLTTDSYGNYLFSGLSNGNYIVSIESPPSGYTYNVPPSLTDSDSVTVGQQRGASIAANNNALGVNFGYYAAAARSVLGTLWNDTNNNGVEDTGETGISGVTISLLQGSTVIATTSTASDGNYSFTGLPSNTYTVKITDNTGVLSGYIGTYEKTEGTTGPFNGQETVVLTSGNQTGVNFGYVSPVIPTLVVLSSFGASVTDGQVVVKWETATEKNTLGFYLLRLDAATGAYRSITEGLLPGLITDPKGGIYTLIDRGAFPGETYQYKLVEVERDGKQLVYGPFSVSVGSKSIAGTNNIKTNSVQAFAAESTSAVSDYSRRARQQSAVRESLIQTRKVSGKTVLEQQQVKTSAATGSRVKIPVAEDGLYYIDATDISAVTGIDSSVIKSWIGARYLSMSNQGRAVAYLPADNNVGIFFYGTGTDSVYTRNNIYWIDMGKGLTMKNETGSVPAPPATDEAFSDSLHIEQDVFPNMSQTTNPAEDYWDWDMIYLSPTYSDGPKSFKFLLNGKADTQEEASLQVHLVGGSDSGISLDHHVVVKLNGQQIGEGLWGGLNPYTLTATFSQTLINEGENTIEVLGTRDVGIPWSMFLIDSFDLNYERLYESDGNRLFFKGDGNESVRVSGFTSASPAILLFNVTNPGTPSLNTSAIIDGSSGNYGISFKPVSPDARYLAIARDAAVRVVNAQGANPSSLRSRSNVVDYLVIAPNELVSSVKPLVDYRSQRMRTKVVTVDDIMNEFNFGLSSPEAIRQFLAYAYKYWSRPPKYVLLAGGGTWDYRDNEGEGGNLIPPAMVPTSYGLSTSDNYLADINGDHVPEMAIGRLPVLTPQEMQNVIRKIKTFEATANNRVIMVADNPDEGGDFSADSEIIAGLFPSRYVLKKVYLGEYLSTETARMTLFNYINAGSVFFNYMGHASFDMLTAEGLFTSDDIASLINGTGLPMVTAMTCTAGEFAIPGYPTISQLMLLKNGGGAVAFWSATGLSDNAEAKILNREFYNAVFNSNKRVLGDAVLQAFSKYKTSGSMPFMMDTYTILGDPALKLR